MPYIETAIIVTLIITNSACLFALIRERKARADTKKYEKVLKEWLKVHLALQKSSKAILEIQKMDSESLMYWKP